MDRETKERALAERLCTELLTAAELKELCRLRGFPVASGAKPQLAAAAAARLLEPRGVAPAMAAIAPPWLRALHLVAASGEALPLGDLRWVQDAGRPHSVDLRALWQKVGAGLLRKGVLLVDEGEPREHWEKSRYARYRLLLPSVMRALLPPFPLPVEPVRGAGPLGRRVAVERRALAAFIARGGARLGRAGEGAEGDLGDRFAALLVLTDGHLRLGDLDRPSAAQLRRRLAGCWEAGLEHEGRYRPPLAAGRVAAHVLGHLPPGQGCRPAALSEALASLGVVVPATALEAFCREGASAGLCRVFAAPDGGVLVAGVGAGDGGAPVAGAGAGDGGALVAGVGAVDGGVQAAGVGAGDGGTAGVTAADGGESEHLVATPHERGVRVDPVQSSLVAVLEAATVCRASVGPGGLVLEPDPVLLGRAAADLAHRRVVAELRAAAPVFETAVAQVLARRDQVIVHTGLGVLRVEDVGLRALLGRRFADVVRPIEGAYLAVLESRAAEVLAFAGKEGYVARRRP